MPSTDFLTYGYAALVATGGLIGYVKAGIYTTTAFFNFYLFVKYFLTVKKLFILQNVCLGLYEWMTI